MKLRTVLLLVGILALLGAVAYITDRAEQRRLAPASRGRLLPKLDATKVTKLEVTVQGVTTTLQLVGGTWKVLPVDLPADDDAVREALKKLEELTRDEIASQNKSSHESLEVKDGQESAIAVKAFAEPAKEPLADVLIGKTGGDFQSNFVRLRGEDEVYRTKDLVRPAFDRGPKGWGDLGVIHFEPDEAVKLELKTRDGGHAAFERTGAGDPWRMTAPVAGPADQTLVEQVVGTLSMLEGDEFATLYDAFTTGLDHPATSAVTLKDGRTLEAQWGKEAPGEQVHVQKKGGEVVYTIALSRMNAVFPELARLRGAEPSASPTVPAAEPLAPALSPSPGASASPASGPSGPR